MTFSHDDIRDRLVDYLYGELDGDARAAFLAHLDGCPRCRGEVTGAEKARAVARTVVRAPLGDAVPERIRARALEAARAAAQKAAVPARAQGAKAAASAAGQGWFGRLRRRWIWTMPTFATVAAMAVFLLVRATIFREAKRPLGETPTGALETAPAPAPSVTAAPVAAPASAERNAVGEPPSPAEPAAAGKPQAVRRKTAPHGGRSAASAGGAFKRDDGPAGAGAGLSPRAAQPGLDDLSTSRGVAGGSASQAGKARSRGADAAPVTDEPLGAVKNASRMKAAKEAAPETPARSQTHAAPPPAPASAPMPSPARNPAKRAFEDMDLDTLSAKKSAPIRDSYEAPLDEEESAPRQQAATEAQRQAPKEAKKGKASTKDKAPLAAPADAASESAVPANPSAALTSRAEGLMSAHRWSEAVTVYRELLRRFPGHPGAPVWRKRLVAAQAALAADTGQFAAPPPPRPGQ